MSDNRTQTQDGNGNIRPPQFIAAGVPGLSASTSAAVQTRGTPSTLNLDDIFGDCFFTPEGEAVFLSENPQLQQQLQQQKKLTQQQQQLSQQPQEQQQGAILGSGEVTVSQNASRPTAEGAGYTPVPQAGGISTTGLQKRDGPAATMGTISGNAAPTTVPMAQSPQRPHHLQYAYVKAGGTQAPASASVDGTASTGAVKRSRSGGSISGVAKGDGSNKTDRR